MSSTKRPQLVIGFGFVMLEQIEPAIPYTSTPASRAHSPLPDIIVSEWASSCRTVPRYARGLATMPANMTANPKSANFESS